MTSLGSRFGFLFFSFFFFFFFFFFFGKKRGLGYWVLFCCRGRRIWILCNRFSRFHALCSLCLIWRLYILKGERFVLETRKEESKEKGDSTYHCS